MSEAGHTLSRITTFSKFQKTKFIITWLFKCQNNSWRVIHKNSYNDSKQKYQHSQQAQLSEEDLRQGRHSRLMRASAYQFFQQRLLEQKINNESGTSFSAPQTAQDCASSSEQSTPQNSIWDSLHSPLLEYSRKLSECLEAISKPLQFFINPIIAASPNQACEIEWQNGGQMIPIISTAQRKSDDHFNLQSGDFWRRYRRKRYQRRPFPRLTRYGVAVMISSAQILMKFLRLAFHSSSPERNDI